MAAEHPNEDEYRFSLKAMLAEIEAEQTLQQQQHQGPVDQDEILKLIKSRKQRGADE